MAIPVSVVIPYYNASAYLPEALASVRSQTAAPAEIVVVDDGSDPAAREALGGCGRDVRIVMLPANRGPGPARNAGVAASTCPYVAFLDADDLWMDEKLALQYEFMRSWPELDATHTGAAALLADGTERVRDPAPRELSVADALSHHVMITPTIMIRRDSFDRIGGFDPSFRCTQDWELQVRMVLAGYRIQYLPRVLTRVRRQHHGHHSADWRCYLAGHLRILWKHRVAYRERGGHRSWIHRVAHECWRAGHRADGLVGACLKLPYRLGV